LPTSSNSLAAAYLGASSSLPSPSTNKYASSAYEAALAGEQQPAARATGVSGVWGPAGTSDAARQPRSGGGATAGDGAGLYWTNCARQQKWGAEADASAAAAAGRGRPKR
jgi:hypothetical protein